MPNSISQAGLFRDISPTARVAVSDAAVKPASGKTLPIRGESTPLVDQKDKDTDTDAKEVKQAVRQLSSYVQNMSRELHISVDEESGRTVVRVIDPVSKDVIRQIPGDEILALARDSLNDKGRGRLLRAQA